MAVTAQQVFDMALVLIDEVEESGNIIASQPEAYKTRALNILTQLQTELLPYSENPVILTDISQTLLLSDRVCLLVLPYGLAAHLLISEDPSTASYFNQRYEELKKKIPADFQPIIDNYDVLSGMM